MVEQIHKKFSPVSLKYLAGDPWSVFDLWIIGELLDHWSCEYDFSTNDDYPTRVELAGKGLSLCKYASNGCFEFACPIFWQGDGNRGTVFLEYSLPQGFTARASFKMFSWWNGYKEFKGDERRVCMPEISTWPDSINDNITHVSAGSSKRFEKFYEWDRYLAIDIDLSERDADKEPTGMFREFDKQYMRLLHRRLKKSK